MEEHKKEEKKARSYKPWIILGIVVIAIALVYIFYYGGTDDPIVAVVNGQSIHESYVLKNYNILPEEVRELIPIAVYLNSTVDERLLVQIAQKNNITVSAEELAESYNTSLQELGLEPEIFLDELKERGVEQEDVIDAFYKKLLIQKFFQQTLYPQIEVSEQELLTLYEQNQEYFVYEGEVAHASHILVATEQEAADLLTELGSGANFAQLALEHSLDPSAALNKGDLGYFPRGQMVPEFEEATFALTKGEISQPIKTQFGYHLVLLHDKQVDGTLPFETVKDTIYQQLIAQKRQALTEALITELRDQAKVEIFEITSDLQ